MWDGEWNDRPLGKCSKVYPIYSNIRVQAGGPWAGSIFKCGRVPVGDAIKLGVYGNVSIGAYQGHLEKIFPDGVCDYAQGDIGKPDLGLTPSLQASKHKRSNLLPLVGSKQELER